MKYKNIFAKGYIPNRSEKVFVIKKVKNTEPLTYVISDVNSEEIAGTIYVQELQKANQTEFKRKVINYMLNGWVMIIHLTNGLMKKILLHKRSYFPEPYGYSKN